jgi:DNA repair photolyase
MTLLVKEIPAKTILSKSKIYPWVINPYTGCQHGCSYCYARFMKRVTGHKEPWGEFVDVKINAPDILRKEITKKKRARVWVSGVCDPYQPLEAKYQLTRQCLEILAQNMWPVIIQTRSPLVLRDIDIIRDAPDFEVGFSITTADDRIRKLFETRCTPDRRPDTGTRCIAQSRYQDICHDRPGAPGSRRACWTPEGKDRLCTD